MEYMNLPSNLSATLDWKPPKYTRSPYEAILITKPTCFVSGASYYQKNV